MPNFYLDSDPALKPTPDGFTRIYTVDSLIKHLKYNPNTNIVSITNELNSSLSGIDFIKHWINLCRKHQCPWTINTVIINSTDSVMRKQMYALLTTANNHQLINTTILIHH